MKRHLGLGFRMERDMHRYILLLLFLSQIHKIRTVGIIMVNEGEFLSMLDWLSENGKHGNTLISLCAAEGLASAWGQRQPAGPHYQSEEDPSQKEQAIYSVQGGWAHPRWFDLLVSPG